MFKAGVALILWFATALQAQTPEFSPSEEVHVSPTREQGDRSSREMAGNSWAARGFSVEDIISEVTGFSPERIDFPKSVDNKQRYDFVLVLPKSESTEEIHRLVQRAVEEKFRLTIAREPQTKDVYVLSAPQGQSPNLKPSAQDSRRTSLSIQLVQGSGQSTRNTEISAQRTDMQSFSQAMEDELSRPVIDETHLAGFFDFQVTSGRTRTELIRSLQDQVGLVLTPDRREVTMLVVRENNH